MTDSVFLAVLLAVLGAAVATYILNRRTGTWESSRSCCCVSRAHLTCDPGDQTLGYNTVVAVVSFAGRVNQDRFWKICRETIIDTESRFRERMCFRTGYMRWIPCDPSWKAEDNFAVIPMVQRDNLELMASSILTKPMDITRPCWELHFVETVQGQDASDTTTAVIFRYHHAMADGFTMIQKMSSRIRPLDASCSLTELFPPRPVFKASDSGWFNPSKLSNFIRSAWTILTMQPDNRGLFRCASHRLPDEKISVAFSGSISVDVVKQIARLGSEKLELGRISVNDVITAIITRAFRLYHLRSKNDFTKASDLTSVIWVSLNKDMESSTDWDNANLGFSYMTLPVSEDDAFTSLGSCHQRSNALKSSVGPLVINTALRMLGSLPVNIGKKLAKVAADNASVSISNLIGPSAPVYWPVSGDDISGAGLIDSVYFATSPPFRFGPLVSVISYCGTLYFSFSARDSLLNKQDLDWIVTEGLSQAVNEFLHP
jgi:diacylglycerol O-acyltransferase